MPRCWTMILVAAVAACAGCLAVENRLVYQPRRTSAAQSRPAPPGVADIEMHLPDGRRIHARWCPHPAGLGAVLYCHGNAGNLEGRGRAVRALWEALGESVLIFDYPGYGRSEGAPDEPGCYAAATAAYDWLTAQGVEPGRIVLFGESLGGGVAVELARQRAHRALVLVRTFTSLPDVASAKIACPTLAGWMHNRFDNLAKLGECRRPVFIAWADRDELIPAGHAQQLLRACVARARLFSLVDSGHNDPPDPDFYTALRRFLDEEASQQPVTGPA